MAITVYNLKKWYKMLTGKSVLHVNQDIGEQFIPGKLRGYFNNMTEKVTKEPEWLYSKELPRVIDEQMNQVEFPVAIFQYGLGAYDLYLKTSDKIYYKKFLQIADWALEKQEESGAWNNFYFYPDHPYGAMCQGEGISLLVRAYKQTKNMAYSDAAERALYFMTKSVEEGGTTNYQGGKACFLEYTHREAVLNGWIFALFGVYDYLLLLKIVGKEDADLQYLYESSVQLLKEKMPLFDNGYWSAYDLAGRIASPFYHRLHIAQLEALYQTTRDALFNNYKKIFMGYQKSWICLSRAFVIKAVQKIKEK